MTLLLAPGVKESLNRFGLGDRVVDILGKAAIVSHPRGNRRYHNWVFNLQGNTLTSVADIRAPVASKPQNRKNGQKPTFVVWEECVNCSGPGCPACGGKGEVKVTRQGE